MTTLSAGIDNPLNERAGPWWDRALLEEPDCREGKRGKEIESEERRGMPWVWVMTRTA